MTFLDLRHAVVDALQRLADRPAHAQGEQGGDRQAGEGQQQTGQQAAVALQQGALVGQFEVDPAEQLVVLRRRRRAGELAVQAVDRQQEARGLTVVEAAEALRLARRLLAAHARPGLGQRHALRIEQGDGAQVALLQALRGQAAEQLLVAGGQRAGAQRRELLGHQLAAFVQLLLHLLQMHPGRVAAEHQRQQRGGQQRQQQDAALDPQIVEHARSPRHE